MWEVRVTRRDTWFTISLCIADNIISVVSEAIEVKLTIIHQIMIP